MVKGVAAIINGGAFIIKSAAVMTALSLVNKTLGVFLRLYVSARIGSEGMGLYQLILSVYTLFSTFATAGFTLSVSRLYAEKSERSEGDARLLLKNAFLLSGAVSLIATLLMLFSAGLAAVWFLRDARTALPLRILALSMPFMAAAACLKGLFLATRRAVVTSSASLFEQAVKFAVIALFLGRVFADTADPGKLCAGIVIGVTLSEVSSFIFLLLFAAIPAKKRKLYPTETAEDSRAMLISVTLPIAGSVCLTSLLHTAESLLVPCVFERFSGDRGYALTQFGTVRGMVIPTVFFPFAFLASLIAVFTPEISRLNTLKDKTARNSRIKAVASLVSLFSVASGGLFFALPAEIGSAFFPGEDTAYAIKILALVTPFMYAETVCDGILKAIGEQMRTLRYTVFNSALRIALILTLVANTGGTGYLWMLVISNTFSYLLCRVRLFRVTGARTALFGDIIIPAVCAACGLFSARAAVDSFFKGAGGTVPAAVGTAVYALVFITAWLVITGGGALKSLRFPHKTAEEGAK